MAEHAAINECRITPIAIAVVEHQGSYLIGRRPEGVALAGMLEFPGGKIAPEETPDDAAVRECREETGLAVEPIGELATVEHQYDHGRVRLHFIACRPVAPDDEPQPPFHWLPANQLRADDFPAANRALIEQLMVQHSTRDGP